MLPHGHHHSEWRRVTSGWPPGHHVVTHGRHKPGAAGEKAESEYSASLRSIVATLRDHTSLANLQPPKTKKKKKDKHKKKSRRSSHSSNYSGGDGTDRSDGRGVSRGSGFSDAPDSSSRANPKVSRQHIRASMRRALVRVSAVTALNSARSIGTMASIPEDESVRNGRLLCLLVCVCVCVCVYVWVWVWVCGSVGGCVHYLTVRRLLPTGGRSTSSVGLAVLLM